MIASSSTAPPRPAERPSAERLSARAEEAFRDALTESFDRLELCDRNMLRFHYFRGLNIEQLAALFCGHPAAVIRQLVRIRERLLRDTRRDLAARLGLDRRGLDRVIDLARDRFDLAIMRIVRA
jgi:RNA polymerase sigma-70 factor, ECF subfamily